MSKIQAVNYQNQPKIAQNNANYAPAQSFGRKLGDYKAIDKSLTQAEIAVAEACEKKIIGRGTRLAEFLARNDGEIEKQLINALFTATLAPIVIGWNPFSKQDEQTKKYMAARQPISAGIAIAGGILMTMPLDAWFTQRGQNGGIPSLDMRMVPDKNVLKKQVKKETPGIKGEALDKAVEAKQKEIKEFFVNLISEDPEKIKIVDGKVKINVEGGKPLTRAIPNITNDAQLNEYLNQNSLHRRKFGDFLKETIGLELYDDLEIKPGAWKEKKDIVSAMEFLRKIGISGKATQVGEEGFDENHLKKILGLYRQEKTTISEVEREAGKGVFKNVKGVVQAFVKESVRNDQMMAGKDGHAETSTLGQLLHRMKIRGKKVPALMEYNIANALEMLAGPLKEFRLENFKQNANLKDFAKNIMENKVSVLDKRFKAYRGFFNVFANLIMAAITCTALNWVYPRFMEIFLPSLANKQEQAADNAKGGNK